MSVMSITVRSKSITMSDYPPWHNPKMSVTKPGQPVEDKSTQTAQHQTIGHKSRPYSTKVGPVTVASESRNQ